MFTEFDKRMKSYERDVVLIPRLPFIVRLDGRAFHTFTRKFKKPYDDRICSLMIETTKALVKEFVPLIGYTQSDEISLLFFKDNIQSENIFGGKTQKITSISAAVASTYFDRFLGLHIPDEITRPQVFDSRVFNLPNMTEVCNYFVWRQQDATRNSILSAAQSILTKKEVENCKCTELQDMLFAKGINWNDYPEYFKRGTFIIRNNVKKVINGNECIRTEIVEISLPPLTLVKNLDKILLREEEYVVV